MVLFQCKGIFIFVKLCQGPIHYYDFIKQLGCIEVDLKREAKVYKKLTGKELLNAS